jgi:hypothetical protein
MQLKSNIYIMPHSCAGSVSTSFMQVLHFGECLKLLEIYAATTKQRTITYKNIINLQKKHRAAKYKGSASVRETNSTPEPQLVQERPFI